jgi:hypothetical protein
MVLVDASGSDTAGRPRTFASLLSENGADPSADVGTVDPAVLADLNFDQVVDAVAGDQEERELIRRLLSRPAGHLDAVSYRLMASTLFRLAEQGGGSVSVTNHVAARWVAP